VVLELAQPPDGKPMHWRTAEVSRKLPPAYRLARVIALAKQGDLKVRWGLGWALQSAELSDAEKLALLEIQKLGGEVNFWNSAVERIPRNELGNVLVGSDWKGGDKTFTVLQKVPSLKTLLLAWDAGVSSAAAAKLRAAAPGLTVRQFDRTPSLQGDRTHITLRNTTDKEVVVYWVSFEGQIGHPRTIKPRSERKQSCYNGSRYEAHVDDKLISKFRATPDAIWEIKP